MKLNEKKLDPNVKFFTGKVVSQSEPFSETGQYWGYQVRVAHTIEEVFDECPYEEGYDLKIGESHHGTELPLISFKQHKGFKHALLFFGGLEGIEGIVEELDENTNLKVSDIKGLFHEYVNSCPERGCRTTSLRTEESILISLGALMPKFRSVGASTSIAKKKEQSNIANSKSVLL